MARSIHPTTEQQAILDAVPAGGRLKIKAYAGAGKTSTLRLVADRLSNQRGTYLAFNREIAEHARRSFPANVSAATVHSLAYRSVAPELAARVGYPAEPPHDLAARFGLLALEVPLVTGKAVEITPFEIGRMIVDGLGRFCRSADEMPAAIHVPVDEKIDPRAADWLRNGLLPYVSRLWDESRQPQGHSAIIPDVYLKVWAQSVPRIDSDFILSQDGALAAQSELLICFRSLRQRQDFTV